VPGRTLNFVSRGKRESLAFARICVGGSPYRLAQLSLLIGLAYWVGPIDLIPARTPSVGHLDEACALIGALVIARRLAPDMLDSAADISATIPARRGVAESLPNFFIVGAARCGTTSLFTALGRHRDVFCCPVKEPNHFCSDRNAKSWVIESAKRRLVLLSRDQPPPPTLPRVATTPDLATYRGLFADWAGQPAVGEASTAYLLSADAARNIADAVPAARIIIVLRHPVHRAQSEYLMHTHSWGAAGPSWMPPSQTGSTRRTGSSRRWPISCAAVSMHRRSAAIWPRSRANRYCSCCSMMCCKPHKPP
jgi:uncharacterized membrane protein YkvA (DUF1232 family)